jgi:hypothetical protein
MPGYLGDSGALRDIFESAVALVVIQQVGVERKAARAAIHRHAAIEAVRVGARLRRGLKVELQVIGDEQVQAAIAVVVEEGAARVVAGAILGKVDFGRCPA